MGALTIWKKPKNFAGSRHCAASRSRTRACIGPASKNTKNSKPLFQFRPSKQPERGRSGWRYKVTPRGAGSSPRVSLLRLFGPPRKSSGFSFCSQKARASVTHPGLSSSRRGRPGWNRNVSRHIGSRSRERQLKGGLLFLDSLQFLQDFGPNTIIRSLAADHPADMRRMNSEFFPDPCV